jgi:hypothetical protein
MLAATPLRLPTGARRHCYSGRRTVGAPFTAAISARADQPWLEARPAGRLIPPLSSGLLPSG